MMLNSKKNIWLKIFVFLNLFFIPKLVLAYVSLVPSSPLGSAASSGNLQGFLKTLYQWGVGVAVALAILFIIFGGIEYMTTDSVYKKDEGKKRITAAVSGLLIVLASWLILNQINPRIFNNDLGLDGSKIDSADPLNTNTADLTKTGNTNNTGDGTSAGTGNVAELTKAGTSFPNQSWNDYALQQVSNSGLLNLSPSDASNYFPNGVTAQGYVSLLASIASRESGFNPNDSMLDVNNTNSVGLLSLSYTDSEAKAAGYSEQDLKDPYKNIEIGVKILKRTIKNGNVISGKNSSGNWTGATAYWSTLR